MSLFDKIEEQTSKDNDSNETARKPENQKGGKEGSKPGNQKTSKTAKKPKDNTGNNQGNQTSNLSTDKDGNKQIDLKVTLESSVTTNKVKYTTFLRPDQIDRIRLEALLRHINDYEYMQIIVDGYFNNK